MADKPITNLTFDQLRAIIREEIDLRLKNLKPSPQDGHQVLADLDKLRWTPPPGSRSTLELLREDRDQRTP